MNTLKKIIALGLNRPGPGVAAVALPQRGRAWALSGGVHFRQWLAALFIAISVTAALSYVLAINAILLRGEAVKLGQKTIAALEQERSALQTRLLAHQSSAWLEAQARTNGMVAVTGIRYLTAHQSVALSR